MNRFLSICLLFTGLILSGLHCTAAAQSSDWVYSPYAQYLTNDTTIPPPVGEPADAALSCFRHDTIYILCTLPSDLDAYPTIPQGMYDAVMGMHNGKYHALKMADVGNAKSEGGRIKLGYVNPAYDDNRTYISSGDIHYAGKDNFTGIGRNGQPVSSACLLIDRNMWDVFIQLFSPSNVVGVAVSRSFKNPISVISPK